MKTVILSTCCWLLVVCSLAQAKESPVASAMSDAAQKFLAALDEKSLAVAVMKFDDPQRMDWHNVPKPNRKGLQFKLMNAQQRELCHNLLKAALSESGYDKACKIMAMENNVREGEKNTPGSPLRDPDRYFLTIFGKPSNEGSWGWSFEGHHLSLNFVIKDGEVIATTPMFFGANPATIVTFVEGGPVKGTRALADEEQPALDLVNSLSESERAKAMIAEKCPADYRAAGKPQPPQTPAAGLPASEMTDAEKTALLALLKIHCDHLASEMSAARMDEIKSDGIDRVYFGWAGGIKAGTPHYFRVQGPSFVLELVNYQSDPSGNPANHIHSVWRNMKGDFAVPIKP